MNEEDIIMRDQYHWKTPDGPIVTVFAKHRHIDHYYIKIEAEDRFDTTKRELLFPLEGKMSKKEEQLSQREWDRVVGIGKTQPPSKGKKPTKPFTNHKPTYDHHKKGNDAFNKNEKND